MSMLDRRLQVLIDDARWERLQDEATRRGVGVSVLVREAIDDRYPDGHRRRRQALREVLDAPEMPVPGAPEDLRRELDDARFDRMARIEA